MKRIAVAKIGKARGVRGQAWLTPLWPDSIPFRVGEDLWIGSGEEASSPFRVADYFEYDKGIVVKLEKVDSLEAMRRLEGMEIFLPADRIPEQEGDLFDTDEVVGFTVEDRGRGAIGTVSGLRQGPAYWVFLVETPAGTEVEVPAVKGLGLRVDTERRTVSVDLPDGYPGLPGGVDAD